MKKWVLSSIPYPIFCTRCWISWWCYHVNWICQHYLGGWSWCGKIWIKMMLHLRLKIWNENIQSMLHCPHVTHHHCGNFGSIGESNYLMCHIDMAKFTTNTHRSSDNATIGWPTMIHFIMGHKYFMATSWKRVCLLELFGGISTNWLWCFK